MDKLISREEVERLRMEYPAGIRVVLVRMEDEQAPPKGTRGTVVGVDDLGSIMVNWDNGSSLSVIYGVDLCERLSREKSVPEIIKDPGRAPRSTDETSEGLPESWSASMKIAQAMGVKLAAEDGYAVFYEERHRLGRTFKSVIDVLSINDPYFTQKFKLSLPLIYRYRRSQKVL